MDREEIIGGNNSTVFQSTTRDRFAPGSGTHAIDAHLFQSFLNRNANLEALLSVSEPSDDDPPMSKSIVSEAREDNARCACSNVDECILPPSLDRLPLKTFWRSSIFSSVIVPCHLHVSSSRKPSRAIKSNVLPMAEGPFDFESFSPFCIVACLKSDSVSRVVAFIVEK